MKTLLSLAMILTLTVQLCAAPIFQEDFSGGVIGNSVTSLGWVSTGAGDGNNIKIGSSPGIGSGQSANFMDVSSAWGAIVSKTFAYTPAANDTYTFTVTLDAPGLVGEYANAKLSKSGSSSAAYVDLGYNDIWLRVDNDSGSPLYAYNAKAAFGDSQPTTPIDVKFELSNTAIKVAVRNYGDSTWIDAGSNPLSGGISLTGFDTVSFLGHGGYAGTVNSILLTVPEPSAIALLVAGLIGWSATSRRKRATRTA
ncbi:MAG: PEP-CTERM sorting domain-containing protein [Lentisphaeria bacterium]